MLYRILIALCLVIPILALPITNADAMTKRGKPNSLGHHYLDPPSARRSAKEIVRRWALWETGPSWSDGKVERAQVNIADSSDAAQLKRWTRYEPGVAY